MIVINICKNLKLNINNILKNGKYQQKQKPITKNQMEILKIYTIISTLKISLDQFNIKSDCRIKCGYI